ncbi:MAG: hypothetical protein ACTHJU_13135 [Sphingopyxis sp.]
MERVAHFTSADGKREVEIERQENGFYRWVEWTQFPGDEYIEDYMSPTHFSGLYDSAEAAARDARCLPWLREENSN